MNLDFGKLWDSAQHMIDTIMARLPSLVVAIAVFILFYILSIFVRRIIRSATRAHRQNLGMAFARLIGGGIILLGFLVGFSIFAPSFQAGDLYKGSRHWQRCHRIRFSKHSAEFSCRLAVVLGRTLSCG